MKYTTPPPPRTHAHVHVFMVAPISNTEKDHIDGVKAARTYLTRRQHLI